MSREKQETFQAGNVTLVSKRSSGDIPDANAMIPNSNGREAYVLISKFESIIIWTQ